MDRYEESMFGGLAVDEADDSWDEYDEADSWDEGDDEADEGDEGDEADEVDSWDEGDESDEVDEVDAWDEGDETDEADDEAWDEVLAQALGAEDSDEFFGRIAKGLRGAIKAVRSAAPSIGKFARAIAPVAGFIPGIGPAVSGVANVVGKLMADEASEDEALDAMAEFAVRNPAARPVLAGLAARKVLGARAAHMPIAQRRQAIRVIRAATNALVRRGGPTAVRALPRIARSVRRTSVARRTPVAARPRVLASTARRVLHRNPRLRRQLTRPLATGRRFLRRVGQYGGHYGHGGGGYYGHGGARTGQAVGGWGGYTHYPQGGYGHGSDYRRIRTRGPVVISIRPR